MNQLIENAGSAQLKQARPFEWLYAGKQDNAPVATYRITGYIDGLDGEQDLLHRTVSLVTGDELSSSHHASLNEEAVSALNQHYDAAYVYRDGLVLLVEFAADSHLYDVGTMPTHEKYGKNIYHADVGELHLDDGDWMMVM